MSTMTQIQEAISRLPANEKSALAAWLQSQEEPIMSQEEEAAGPHKFVGRGGYT